MSDLGDLSNQLTDLPGGIDDPTADPTETVDQVVDVVRTGGRGPRDPGPRDPGPTGNRGGTVRDHRARGSRPTGLSLLYLDTLHCVIPEDVNGDETYMEIRLEGPLIDRTVGVGIDQVNGFVHGLAKVDGFSVSPQVPKDAPGKLVWKASKSERPVKAGAKIAIRWVVPFRSTSKVLIDLWEEDRGRGAFIDPDDHLGKREISSTTDGKGIQVLEWKGGTRVLASRYHYKLAYRTQALPAGAVGSPPARASLLRSLIDPPNLPRRPRTVS